MTNSVSTPTSVSCQNILQHGVYVRYLLLHLRGKNQKVCKSFCLSMFKPVLENINNVYNNQLLFHI